MLGFLISGMRKLLTWATLQFSDFEEGDAAELRGGALGRRLGWDSKSSLHLVSWRSEPFGGTLQEWFDGSGV